MSFFIRTGRKQNLDKAIENIVLLFFSIQNVYQIALTEPFKKLSIKPKIVKKVFLNHWTEYT